MKILKVLIIMLILLILFQFTYALEKTTLRFGDIQAINHPRYIGAVAFSNYVASKTDGRINIEIYPLSQLGGVLELFQGVREGTIDIAISSDAMGARIDKSFNLFSIPYLNESPSDMMKIIEGPIGKEFEEKLANMGIRVLSWGLSGIRHITTNRPVYKVSDMKGFIIRMSTQASRSASFKALGVTPETSMSLSETYLALQQGVIDGQEGPIAQTYTQKFYEVNDYLILTGHEITPVFTIMNERKFQEFSKEDQKILLEGSKLGSQISDNLLITQESSMLEEMKNKGLKVITPDNSFMLELKDKTKDVILQIPEAQEYYNMIQKNKNK